MFFSFHKRHRLRAFIVTKKRNVTTENGFRHTNVTIGFGTLHAPQQLSCQVTLGTLPAPQQLSCQVTLGTLPAPSRFYAKSVESIVFCFGVPNSKNYRRP